RAHVVLREDGPDPQKEANRQEETQNDSAEQNFLEHRKGPAHPQSKCVLAVILRTARSAFRATSLSESRCSSWRDVSADRSFISPKRSASSARTVAFFE